MPTPITPNFDRSFKGCDGGSCGSGLIVLAMRLIVGWFWSDSIRRQVDPAGNKRGATR